jgi:NADPH-dependent 2,4-dienoyl-CoA reductase/sulfur reductase-like enzyme
MNHAYYDVVVIGGGVAGGEASVRLSRRGLKTLLISKDPVVYSRMTLSYALIHNVKDLKYYTIYTENDLKRENVDFINDEVTYIDRDKRVIETRKGLKIEYDRAVIATGGAPRKLDIEGINLRGVYTFTSFDDIINISNALYKSKRALVIGAGMIGLLATGALVLRGLDVTLIDILERPGMTVFERPLADLMLKRLEMYGVKFIGGTSVEQIKGRNRVERVVLNNGEKMYTDLIILAVGVSSIVPHGLEDLAKGPGNSLLTDDSFRTSDRNIYAIGDCASTIDLVTKRSVYRPLGIIASHSARILPDIILENRRYEGFLAYQVEETLRTIFIRLGLNSFEARNLGLLLSRARISVKTPGIGYIKNIILYERDSGRIVGWQNMGVHMTSYKSKIFEEMIRKKLIVYELEKKFREIQYID